LRAWLNAVTFASILIFLTLTSHVLGLRLLISIIAFAYNMDFSFGVAEKGELPRGHADMDTKHLLLDAYSIAREQGMGPEF
jgi:hypothetical protein